MWSEMLTHVIITLLSCVPLVIGHFQCQGTCYKGSFPKGNDVIKRKHLRGYSYKNITTDVPQVCFSSCVSDCRCKAFQMKDVRCELLDEDKTSKAGDFVNETGYVYYDLQQKFYKVESHMVQHKDTCYNGCCRSQPCQNGGICVEHCDDPKVKFSCTCSRYHYGKVCEKRHVSSSCLDVLNTYIAEGKMPGNGVYHMECNDLTSNRIQPFYCAFEGTTKAWTLIESFSLANKDLYADKNFGQGYPRNVWKPPTTDWTDYRISANAMLKFLRPKSKMFRATCDFPIRDSLTPDFLLGYLSDCDIVNNNQMSGHCCKFPHINIRGHDFYNTTAPVWHHRGMHAHIGDSNHDCCTFIVPGSVSSEDNFGYYTFVNPNSTCTATQNSTTQWWLGEEK